MSGDLRSAASRTALLVAICAIPAVAQRTLAFFRDPLDGYKYLLCAPDFVRLRWSESMFLAVEGNWNESPTICTATRDGIITRIPLQIPDAGSVFVYDVAANAEGTVAVVGSTISKSSEKGTFLALVPPNRSKATVVRLTPYVPRKVIFSSNDTIWTIGWVLDASGDFKTESGVVQVLDKSGRLRMRFNYRTDTPTNDDRSFLKSSKDRIALLTSENEYIEFSLTGKVLVRLGGPPFMGDRTGLMTSFTISGDNEPVVGQAGQNEWTFWGIDRKVGKWYRIPIQDEALPSYGEVLGFENNRLLLGTNVLSSPRIWVYERIPSPLR